MTATGESMIEELRELVGRHRVCWEVWPEYLYVAKERRQVGSQLELCGTHEPEVEHPEPGCPDCQRIFVALRAIADWILPTTREDVVIVFERASIMAEVPVGE